MAKNVHTVVLPDGTTRTRKSHAHIRYTHCLIGKQSTGEWVTLAYSRNEQTLARQLSGWPSKAEKRIVPVTVNQLGQGESR